MKQLILNLIAIFFPWLALLIYDNPLGAILALIMQITIIGWIPATVWAWQTVHPHKKKKTKTDNEEAP